MRSKSRSSSSAPTLSKAHKHFQSAKRTLAGASPTSPSLTPRNSGAARPGTGSSLSQSWSSIGECIDTPHVIGKQCPGPNSGDSGCILVSRSRLHEETTPVVDSAAHDLAHAGLQTSTRAETRRRRPTDHDDGSGRQITPTDHGKLVDVRVLDVRNTFGRDSCYDVLTIRYKRVHGTNVPNTL